MVTSLHPALRTPLRNVAISADNRYIVMVNDSNLVAIWSTAAAAGDDV